MTMETTKMTTAVAEAKATTALQWRRLSDGGGGGGGDDGDDDGGGGDSGESDSDSGICSGGES